MRGSVLERFSGDLAGSVVGVFVSLEKLEQDHLLPLVVEIVQDPVRTDTQSVLCREL